MPDDPILLALANVNPNLPLEPEDHRFVDLDEIRGFALRKRILRQMCAEESAGRYAKIVVAGHRGSGKSTELNRTQQELAGQQYVCLWASVNENLDPNEISFSDVMRLIIQLLDDRFGADASPGTPLRQAFDVVRDWFREVTKTHTQDIDNARELGLKAGLGGRFGVEADASAGAVFAKAGVKAKTDLGELAAAISVLRRSEGRERTEIKETLERYNNQLVENVNALLRGVSASGPAPLKLAIILDNVDKYEAEVVNAAFLRHSALFQELESHLVFTIQASLLHRPVEYGVDQSFTTFTLPMLPIFQPRSRDTDPNVLAALREAVFLRVPETLFEDADNTASEVIRLSGGCWRDMLRLLEDALLGADARITRRDIKRARQNVAQTFQRLLRSQEDLQILAQVHRDHTLLADDRAQYLLLHRCLLSYNGEGWYDIHPLLDEYPPLKQALAAQPA